MTADPRTLLLTRSSILRHLDPVDAAGVQLAILREPDPVARSGRRTIVPLPCGSATALLPGRLSGLPAYTVKVNAKFPGAAPALRGVVILHALGDGGLLALLDSATVTAWRTGLAAAAVIDALLPARADTLGVIGAGAQSQVALAALTRLRRLRALRVHDTRPAFAERLVDKHMAVPDRQVVRERSAVGECSAVITATWSRDPVMGLADVSERCRVLVSLGFDEPGKRELADDLLAAARLVVDDHELASRGGVLSGGIVRDALSIDDALRAGPGTGPLVYAPVGMPWQDLALAWHVYERSLRDPRVPRIDLLA